MLPDWSSTVNPSVNLDYGGLKAAAIQMARFPECVQQAVIREYYYKYRAPKSSGLYVLIRVLFVLPSDYRPSNRGMFTGWSGPVGTAEKRTKTWDYQWPVHVNPHESVLDIERCQTQTPLRGYVTYQALDEYLWLKRLGFPKRSAAEIEALEIRGRP